MREGVPDLWTEGPSERQTDRPTDGWTNGQTDQCWRLLVFQMTDIPRRGTNTPTFSIPDEIVLDETLLLAINEAGLTC